MMWKKIVLLMGILTAFVILVMPVVSAQNMSVNTIYFLPQHGVIQEPSNNITVQVRANLSADSPINVWQTNISFDPTCVNITEFTLPDPATGWSYPLEKHHVGCIEIGAVRFACGDADSDILLANLTIHCEAWCCTSPLNFTGIVNITRFIGCTQDTPRMYHAAWINGTVTIETEEQNGEEQHAPGDGGTDGNKGAGSAYHPSPSPTPTEVAAAPSPTLAPTSAPSSTPAQTPSSTIPPPTADDQKQTLMWVIGLMAGSIVAITIYVVFKLRK